MKPVPASALSKAKLQKYVRLHQKKFRDQEGLFLAEGLRTVRELCLNLPEEEMLVALLVREGDVEALRFAQPWKGKLFSISEKECSQLADTATSQGVFGVFRQQRMAEPAAEALLAKSVRSFLVALDDVQDPGNVGTILRTAVWFGADGVICSAGRLTDTIRRRFDHVPGASMPFVITVLIVLTLNFSGLRSWDTALSVHHLRERISGSSAPGPQSRCW